MTTDYPLGYHASHYFTQHSGLKFQSFLQCFQVIEGTKNINP
jgi:hypothetical protein